MKREGGKGRRGTVELRCMKGGWSEGKKQKRKNEISAFQGREFLLPIDERMGTGGKNLGGEGEISSGQKYRYRRRGVGIKQASVRILGKWGPGRAQKKPNRVC